MFANLPCSFAGTAVETNQLQQDQPALASSHACDHWGVRDASVASLVTILQTHARLVPRAVRTGGSSLASTAAATCIIAVAAAHTV